MRKKQGDKQTPTTPQSTQSQLQPVISKYLIRGDSHSKLSVWNINNTTITGIFSIV